MILGHLAVTVINQGPPTSYETLGTALSTPILTAVYNCSLEEHRTKRDINDLTDVLTARWRLFAPASAPLTGTSQVVVGIFTAWPLPDGTDVFMVDGDPAIWRGRNSIVHHIECYLRQQGG
jgi:hypothetical protein